MSMGTAVRPSTDFAVGACLRSPVDIEDSLVISPSLLPTRDMPGSPTGDPGLRALLIDDVDLNGYRAHHLLLDVALQQIDLDHLARLGLRRHAHLQAHRNRTPRRQPYREPYQCAWFERDGVETLRVSAQDGLDLPEATLGPSRRRLPRLRADTDGRVAAQRELHRLDGQAAMRDLHRGRLEEAHDRFGTDLRLRRFGQQALLGRVEQATHHLGVLVHERDR